MRTLATTGRNVSSAGTAVAVVLALPSISVLAVFALLMALAPTPAAAGMTTQTAGELSLVVGYSDGNDWVGALPGSQRSAAGFEHFAKFSTDRGDIVTTNLQLRASYDSCAPSDEAWALEVHNAWLEYRLGLGKKLRIGHFSPAHGLEPVRDTHGTLAQTLVGMDLGFKKDWGIGYSGIAGPLDLEVALQLGSGMAPAPDDGSYLASAQVWTPPGRDSRFGVSIVRGDLRKATQARTLPLPDYAEESVEISRAALSVEHSAGAFMVLAEASAGVDDSSTVGGALFQVDYSPPSNQRWLFAWQVRVWDSDLARGGFSTVTGIAAAGYKVTDRLTVRAALTELARDCDHAEAQATIQLYYYGG